MRCLGRLVIAAVFMSLCSPVLAVLTPSNIAVVVNTDVELNGQSVAAGRYYCAHAGIPLSNLIEIAPGVGNVEHVTAAQYDDIAEAIRLALVDRFHVDPDDPANDPIQVLVLCYGVPSIILGSSLDYNRAVDSYLTLLFNTNPDIGPAALPGPENGNKLTPGCTSPYSGKNTDFETFRASSDNTITWGGETYKMRYMVCRLDAYSTDPVTTQYGSMPRDVRDLIDRGAATRSVPLPEMGRFVLDEPWNGIGGGCFNVLDDVLTPIVGSSLVVHDRTVPECYVKTFGDALGVTAHTGSGMHDRDIVANTEWGRPYFNWKPGAVCVIGESYAGAWVRRFSSASWESHGNNTTPTLEVTAGISELALKKLTGYRIAVLNPSGQPVKWTRNGQPVDVEAYVDSAGIAQIDVSDPTIQWPQQGVLIRGYFPADDQGYHDGECFTGTYVCMNEVGGEPEDQHLDLLKASGLKLTLKLNRQKIGEYIRDGCSGGPGNVSESVNYLGPELTLPRYAGGYPWAEAAYMGTPTLAEKTLIIGDPLMRIYQAHPTVEFATPAPGEGDVVDCVVSLVSTAEPEKPGDGIVKVEYWVSDGETRTNVGTSAQAPYPCEWNTEELRQDNSRVWPDGQYTLEAVAYERDSVYCTGTTSRTVTVDDSHPSVGITVPNAEDAVLVTGSSGYTVSAGVTGGETPAGVQFWLLGESRIVQIADDTTAPYEGNIVVNEQMPEGVYELVAVAYGDNGAYYSYSASRRALVLHDPPASGLADLPNQTEGGVVLIGNLPVTAGTAAVGDGFYIQDPDRANGPVGIRVHSAETVATGDRVTVRGTFHRTGAGFTERYIEATGVWTLGTADLPRPLAMSPRDLGGVAPTGCTGVTGAVEVYNTGLLVTVAGRVSYAGPNYLYVDDPDPRMYDGNSFPVYWLWNGGRVSGPPANRTSGAPGVCVYRALPSDVGAGDYVCVTGISSTKQIGENVVRYLIPPAGSDISVQTFYMPCGKYDGDGLFYWDEAFPPDCDNPISVEVGSQIRLTDAVVQNNTGTQLVVSDMHSGVSTVNAETAFTENQIITVLGTIVEGELGDEIDADFIYCAEEPGGQQGLMAGTEGGMQASQLLMVEQPGSIEDALSQADGTSVTLDAVQVSSVASGYFGVKEISEIVPTEPRLLVSRTYQVGQSWIVDVQGTITTLAGGQRAIAPASVWLYTDAAGRPAPPWAWMVGSEWPHKTQIQ